MNDCKTGIQTSTTQILYSDLDQDGENEYVMKNNKVYACFEKYGGRMINAFIYDSVSQDGISVIGSPVSNPSAPGEEEFTSPSANRCSALKDMNNGTYADMVYNVSTATTTLILTSNDGNIVKKINLSNSANQFNVAYIENVSGSLCIRVGASPNNLDLIKNGRANLIIDSTSGYYGVRNTQGGAVYVTLGGGAFYNTSPLYGGFENRNLSLTQEIEIYGSGTFSFNLLFNQSALPVTDWSLF